ncbi:MAG: PilZ domain-containing protein [Myxococcota bacterium]|nr:PilZ domain-containing protein [Myxococcota bacterium]
MAVKTSNRRTARVSCEAPAKAEGPRGPIRGTCRSLSQGGMFFSGTQLPVGQSVELSVQLPSGQFLAVGQVRYHHTDALGPGMGIKFTRLAQDHLSRIVQFVGA